jgi:hypothetical protein
MSAYSAMVVQSMLPGGRVGEVTFGSPSLRCNSLVGQTPTRYLLSHLKEVGVHDGGERDDAVW